jgi:hypothetical protein
MFDRELIYAPTFLFAGEVSRIADQIGEDDKPSIVSPKVMRFPV